MLQQLIEQPRIDRAPTGDRTVHVARSADEPSRQSVDEGVAGSRVPCHGIEGRAGRDERDVRDAADVERRDGPVLLREQERVEEADQRRALAAGGDVARPEVGDDRSARALGDHRRLADLQARERAAVVVDRVVHGLAVRGDEVDLADGESRRADRGRRDVGEGIAGGDRRERELTQ